MLANSRILKLKTRAKYEINSMGISRGATAKGTPDGRKFDAKFHLLFTIPIKVTAMKWASASQKVITNELVHVNEYGSNPTKFEMRITKKRKKRMLKYQ